jgi:hypothetical protein
LKVAIIISGLLRLAKKNTLILQEISSKYDVFVCTSVKDREHINCLGNIKGVSFIEDDHYINELQNNLLQIPEGSKLLQWQKLSKAFSMMELYELEKGMQYECVYKIRTDLIFNNDFKLDTVQHHSEHKSIFMNSDIYFGGNRNVMKIASSFFLKALGLYCNNSSFNSFDLNLLRECDRDAAKFEWLNYPYELVDGVDNFMDFWNKITSSKSINVKTYSGRIKNFREDNKSIFFPSEAAFLNYLLAENINIKKMHDNPFRIDENRKFNRSEVNTYNKLRQLFNDNNYREMIAIYSKEDFFADNTADLYRDAALAIFEFDRACGLRLISIANDIRPHGPYIKRLKHEFEKIMGSE